MRLLASTVGSVSSKTRLAVAPLLNIGGMQGKICFGWNEVPETHPSTLAEVWRLIFETPFNHDNVNDKCVSEPTDVRNLLVSLAQERPKKFPQHLVKMDHLFVGVKIHGVEA